MSPFKRFIGSMRRSIPFDASFESYYGTLVRHQPTGGPSASEARRDYASIRTHIDRSMFY